jgi:hypothetical protein
MPESRDKPKAVPLNILEPEVVDFENTDPIQI